MANEEGSSKFQMKLLMKVKRFYTTKGEEKTGENRNIKDWSKEWKQ